MNNNIKEDKLLKIQKALNEFDRDTEIQTYQIVDTIRDILNEVEE